MYSFVLAVVIAVPLAVVAATHRDRWPDQAVRALVALPLASPAFWIGILLLIVFALKLGWFPATGYGEGFLGPPPAPVPAGPDALARLRRPSSPATCARP